MSFNNVSLNDEKENVSFNIKIRFQDVDTRQ